MKKYKIIWSPKAKDELNAVYKYIAFNIKESNSAKNLLKKITTSILHLNYLPQRHLKMQDYPDKWKNIRKLLVDKYVVIYEVKNDTRTSIYFTYFS